MKARRPECRFDRETHTYWIGGIQVPSVTSLIPVPMYQGDFIKAGQDEHARAARGDFEHYTNKLTGKTLSKQFGKIVCKESPLFSRRLMFGGTPDRVTEKYVIDFKRQIGNLKPVTIQTAGYRILVREVGFTGLWRRKLVVVEFDHDTETFNFRILDDKGADETFLALLKRRDLDRRIDGYFFGKASS